MKFPVKFSRFKGAAPAGSIALGSDAAPTTQLPAATMDNLLSCRFNNINGWPIHRVAVVYRPPSGALALTAQMWFWESNIGRWFAVGDAKALAANAVTFFDVIGLGDMPATDTSGNTNTMGSIAQVLVVTDPGAAPDGEHIIALAPDLTTAPF